MAYKDGSTYDVKLTDSKGNPIVNAVVKFTICNRTYNIKTKSDGIAKLAIGLNKGVYNVTASFNNTYYRYVETTNTITVTSRTSITAHDINMTYKDGTTYDVQLVDGNGNPIAQSGV